eukprot:m.1641027 g.1641027  ORF g.1641027 m.1641027 type:complete len:67 (+) comp44994_c0_seq1:199-399(+)
MWLIYAYARDPPISALEISQTSPHTHTQIFEQFLKEQIHAASAAHSTPNTGGIFSLAHAESGDFGQ